MTTWRFCCYHSLAMYFQGVFAVLGRLSVPKGPFLLPGHCCMAFSFECFFAELKPRFPFPHTLEYLEPYNSLTVIVNDFFCSELEVGFVDTTTAFIKGIHKPPRVADLGYAFRNAVIRDPALPGDEQSASFCIMIHPGKDQAFSVGEEPVSYWRPSPPRVVFKLLPKPKAAAIRSERPKHTSFCKSNCLKPPMRCSKRGLRPPP